jgi:hypothetical protein
MFPHRSIHKYTWTSPDGNAHNQINNILIDRQRHSSVLDVRSFRAADCDTDHYLLVAKIRERIAVNKQGSHKFHMEREINGCGGYCCADHPTPFYPQKLALNFAHKWQMLSWYSWLAD